MEETQAVASEVSGVAKEREIVHGDDERRRLRGYCEGGRVHDVDRPGRALYRGPSQAMPAFVESGPGQRKLRNPKWGSPRLGGRFRMAGRDADDINVCSCGQRARGLDCSDGGATRHAMPALLHRERNAQPVIFHGRIVARWLWGRSVFIQSSTKNMPLYAKTSTLSGR